MDDLDPSLDRAAEVEQLLSVDETWLGEVWARHRQGLSASQIADEYEITQSPVHAYLALIRCLRDGELTTSPTVATRHASRIRSWLKSKPLSVALRAALERQEAALNSVAENVAGREEEDQAAAEETARAVEQGPPGIYVYTLPHYLRHRFDPETGKTLLKVGHSAKDAYSRATSQFRLTALPEDPILLRIYPAEESAQVERQFHSWLADADHTRSEARRGGSEWFVTSTRFLDRVARAMGLEVRTYNNEFDLGD